MEWAAIENGELLVRGESKQSVCLLLRRIHASVQCLGGLPLKFNEEVKTAIDLR